MLAPERHFCYERWDTLITGELMTFDLEQTDRLLSTTRAVRKRLDLDRPVDPAVVTECLQLAIQAPTGSNSQNWRWMVVTDPDKRAALARLYNEGGAAYLAAQAEADHEPQTKRVYQSALALTEILHRVPVFVIPCIERRFDGAINAINCSAYGSIMPAAWSFMLALRSRGLGSVFTTLHLFKEQESAAVLGIPYESVTQIALIPVAHTIGTDFKPADRGDVRDITSWNTWGEHAAS
jgi:nitroreductase